MASDQRGRSAPAVVTVTIEDTQLGTSSCFIDLVVTQSPIWQVHDAELGTLCFLCDARAGADVAVVTPTDAYRIAAFVQPLGLYIQAQCGTLRSLTLRPSALLGSGPGPGAAATFEVTFDGGAPCAALRPVLGKTAKAMPGGDFSVVGARLVRGAYELKPAAGGGPTVAKVAYTV